jgi:hypothetical protein
VTQEHVKRAIAAGLEERKKQHADQSFKDPARTPLQLSYERFTRARVLLDKAVECCSVQVPVMTAATSKAGSAPAFKSRRKLHPQWGAARQYIALALKQIAQDPSKFRYLQEAELKNILLKRYVEVTRRFRYQQYKRTKFEQDLKRQLANEHASTATMYIDHGKFAVAQKCYMICKMLRPADPQYDVLLAKLAESEKQHAREYEMKLRRKAPLAAVAAQANAAAASAAGKAADDEGEGDDDGCTIQ